VEEITMTFSQIGRALLIMSGAALGRSAPILGAIFAAYFGAICIAWAAGDEPTTKIGKITQPLVGGTEVNAETQELLGLVTIRIGSGRCSGSLLTNEWIITADHCVRVNANDPKSMTVPMSGVTVVGIWKSYTQTQQAVEIVRFNPDHDIAMIRVRRTFSVVGQNFNFGVSLSIIKDLGLLNNHPVYVFGSGIKRFATGSGASATPSEIDGKFRFGGFTISNGKTAAGTYDLTTTGPMIAGGDSGGPTFMYESVNDPTTRILLGVHSDCTFECVPGKSCDKTGWTWVARTPVCTDAAVQPVQARIRQVIIDSASRPIATEFQGTFATTPKNTAPIWLYVVKHNGDLMWYRQDSNTSAWSGPRKAGTGWTALKHVIPAGGNIFYGITPAGEMKWFQHNGFNGGTMDWQPTTVVSHGWNTYSMVFGGSDGVVYAIKPDGTLYWYQHGNYKNGRPELWQGPKQIGTGWNSFTTVFSMGGGIIYGVKPNGDLIWHKHEGVYTGESKWGASHQVGTGWNGVAVLPAGDGIILGIKPDGSLWWYKHTSYETGISMGLGKHLARWEQSVRIGSGWKDFHDVFALLPGAKFEGPK
jgi:hypothetical protein